MHTVYSECLPIVIQWSNLWSRLGKVQTISGIATAKSHVVQKPNTTLQKNAALTQLIPVNALLSPQNPRCWTTMRHLGIGMAVVMLAFLVLVGLLVVSLPCII